MSPPNLTINKMSNKTIISDSSDMFGAIQKHTIFDLC